MISQLFQKVNTFFDFLLFFCKNFSILLIKHSYNQDFLV